MARPPKAVRDDLLNDTRQRLLDAAADEFACEGFSGANINRISLSAGFAKGTVYNHFASKQALMFALIDDIAEAHIAAIAAHIRPGDRPAQQLGAFFVGGFAFVEEFPARARTVISAVYGPDVELKACVYAAYRPLFDLLIHDILTTGITRGDFRPVDADTTAAMIMSVYLGACSQLEPDGRIWTKPEQIMTFILDGLRSGD